MDPAIASIIVSIITAIGVAIASFLANRRANAAMTQATTTHNLVNSRMTELLELAKRASKAEGAEEERLKHESEPQQVEVINVQPVPVVVNKEVKKGSVS